MMLVMPEHTQKAMAELSIIVDALDVRRASAWLEQIGEAYGIPVVEIGRLELCLHEVLGNIISHGGEAGRAPVELRITIGEHLGLRETSVTVIDTGHRFDATTADLKVRPSSLAKAEPGGLGLMMIRSFSDAQTYRHHDKRNELTFTVRWSEG